MDNEDVGLDPRDVGYIGSEFQWEHCKINDRSGIVLTCRDSYGDDVQIIFDYQSMDEFMIGALDYFNYLKEKST